MNALISLYDALVSINVPADKARAVVDAVEREMTTLLATKSDLATLKKDIDTLGVSLRAHTDAGIELLRASMTIRLGSMLVVVAGLLFAALKLTWPAG